MEESVLSTFGVLNAPPPPNFFLNFKVEKWSIIII